MRTSRLLASGLGLHAVHLGEGDARPSVVLVHGMVVAGRGMLPLARALASRGFAVHVPDLPGFGRSDAVRYALDVEASAEVLATWMIAAGISGSAMLGNSFGTQVAAAAVAGGAPVSKLVLLSPTIDTRWRGQWMQRLPPGPGGIPRRRRRAPLGRAVHERLVPSSFDAPGLLSVVLREHLAAGPGMILSTYRHALRDDITRRMPAVSVQLLVARGSKDHLVSEAFGRSLADSAPQGSFVEVPGVDHNGQYLAAAVVAGALAGFLIDAPQLTSMP